jgi:hypothetical protein
MKRCEISTDLVKIGSLSVGVDRVSGWFVTAVPDGLLGVVFPSTETDVEPSASYTPIAGGVGVSKCKFGVHNLELRKVAGCYDVAVP